MDFTDLVVHTRIKKHPFGGGGLAGVDMRGDTDVAVVFNGGSAGHKLLSVRIPNKKWVLKQYRVSNIVQNADASYTL